MQSSTLTVHFQVRFRPLRKVHCSVAHITTNWPCLIRFLWCNLKNSDRVLSFSIWLRGETIGHFLCDFHPIWGPRYVCRRFAIVSVTCDVVRRVNNDTDNRTIINVRLVGRCCKEAGRSLSLIFFIISKWFKTVLQQIICKAAKHLYNIS